MKNLMRVLAIMGVMLTTSCIFDTSDEFDEPGIWHFTFSSVSDGYSGEFDLAIFTDGEFKTITDLTDPSGKRFSALILGSVDHGGQISGELAHDNIHLGYLFGHLYNNLGQGYLNTEHDPGITNWSAYRVVHYE